MPKDDKPTRDLSWHRLRAKRAHQATTTSRPIADQSRCENQTPKRKLSPSLLPPSLGHVQAQRVLDSSAASRWYALVFLAWKYRWECHWRRTIRAIPTPALQAMLSARLSAGELLMDRPESEPLFLTCQGAFQGPVDPCIAIHSTKFGKLMVAFRISRNPCCRDADRVRQPAFPIPQFLF